LLGRQPMPVRSAFAEYVGARHALAVSSGTAALHLALIACGCGPGDEVVLPALNFVAAANVVRHAGATPVFCDVRSAEDLNLDPESVASSIGPATKAVVVLHYAGWPCAIDAVTELASARGVSVVEDAAHAPGATVDGRACGTIGEIGCFSFFSNKNLAVGEGGMVVTAADGLAETMRLNRSHGMTTLTWDRHRGHAHAYDVVASGYNYRLDELRAALGLVQLARLDEHNAARARLAGRYRELLSVLPGVTVPFGGASSRSRSAHHLQVVVLPEGVDRDAVRAGLHAERIQTSVHYPPIHRFSAFAGPDGSAASLPVTEAIAPRLLTLPLYPTMTDAQVELVVDVLAAELARA